MTSSCTPCLSLTQMCKTAWALVLVLTHGMVVQGLSVCIALADSCRQRSDSVSERSRRCPAKALHASVRRFESCRCRHLFFWCRCEVHTCAGVSHGCEKFRSRSAACGSWHFPAAKHVAHGVMTSSSWTPVEHSVMIFKQFATLAQQQGCCQRCGKK